MKRKWLQGLTLTVAAAGAQAAVAQFPAYNYNTAPSSYPVQPPSYAAAPPAQTMAPPQSPGPGVPIYPYGYHPQPGYPQPQPAYSQPQSGHSVPAQLVQQPLPIAPQYAPVPLTPPVAGEAAVQSVSPATNGYPYPQSGIGGCATCGPTAGYSYFQPAQTNPYAFSAPSIGCGNHGGHKPFLGDRWGGKSGQMCGLPECAKPWFFGGGVLIFRRIDDYNRLLTVDDMGMPNLYTEDARLGTMAGFEVMGGRYFNCGRHALVASYWGLFPNRESVDVGDGDGVRSAIFLPWATPADHETGEFQLYEDGAPDHRDVYYLYDQADFHRLRRYSNFHNVEINLLGFGVGCAARNFNRPAACGMFSGSRGHRGDWAGYGANCGPGDCGPGANDCGPCYSAPSRYTTGPCGYVAPPCGSRLNLTWLAGFRYFHFSDNLEYSAWGVPDLDGPLSYDVNTRNDLFGGQIGGRADYCVGNCLNLYTLARAGIYGNNASLWTRLGTDDAEAYESGMVGMPNAAYDVRRRTNQLAFMSELGTGLGLRFSSKWTATVGYRAIVASGVATSVGNIRYPGSSVSRIGINAKDYIVLHGLDIGALYNF